MARLGDRDRDRHILVAFDFGLRRIGIATANRETRTASPLTTVRVEREPPWRELDRIIDDWRPGQLVVGVPEGDGAAEIARRARAFAAALAERYGMPVATVDETLTSAAAESELAEKRRSGYLRRRVGKGGVDRVAACLIAEQWMSQQ
ncbi:MAG TPA: Holliday junction resolvase RuvX [Gammaproteobacteria bacterium]|nr:Holliday junction resolvase RuvX [Gammaproteobacteria bacterium]